MKENDFGVMEEQIFSEESSSKENGQEPQTPKKSIGKISLKPPSLQILYGIIKKSTQLMNYPKIFVILGLFIIIMTVFIALISISTNPQNIPINTASTIYSSSPTPQLDPEVEKLKKQTETFYENIEEIEKETKGLQFPKVDLDISF